MGFEVTAGRSRLGEEIEHDRAVLQLVLEVELVGLAGGGAVGLDLRRLGAGRQSGRCRGRGQEESGKADDPAHGTASTNVAGRTSAPEDAMPRDSGVLGASGR